MLQVRVRSFWSFRLLALLSGDCAETHSGGALPGMLDTGALAVRASTRNVAQPSCSCKFGTGSSECRTQSLDSFHLHNSWAFDETSTHKARACTPYRQPPIEPTPCTPRRNEGIGASWYAPPKPSSLAAVLGGLQAIWVRRAAVLVGTSSQGAVQPPRCHELGPLATTSGSRCRSQSPTANGAGP